MDCTNTCRFCLAQGLHKDLASPYIWLDKKEVYAEMLQECFNIALCPTSYASNRICDMCIACLRSSLSFKQTVLRAEEELMVMLKEKDSKPVEVKLENFESADDDSDYCIHDAVPEVEIKEEVKEPKKKLPQKRVKKKSDKSAAEVSWRADNIKNLVTKFATIKTGTRKDPKLSVKKKGLRSLKFLIPPDGSKEDQPKINLLWTSRMNADKLKHRENLQAILEFSNVMPFKDKTLLGFACGYCNATFPDPADLRTHTETDHKKIRLNFKSNFDMTEYHVKVDTTDLTCALCDEKLDNLTLLRDHLVKIHGKTIHKDIKDHILQFKLKKGEVYDCAMCSATYETFKMLKQHMNIHYCNYSCLTCEAKFATKRSLNAHRTTHEEGSFKCEYCDKIFPSKAKKQYHEKTKHLGARNISNCPYCNEPFRSYYQRNQHLIKVHNAEAQYKCNICNKTYILKSLLMYHIKKNHLMERNCQCSECGYRFFSKKALKAHMVKHTGERNYQCEVCHKSYARKYTLREHMRIHNNDRRFRCEVCSMSFVQKCSLKSHLLSNHGISMAACEIISSTVPA